MSKYDEVIALIKDDLEDRKGLGFDDVEDEIMDEIKHAWKLILLDVLGEE